MSTAFDGSGWRRWRPGRTGGRRTAATAKATARVQASSHWAHDSSEGGSRNKERSRRAWSSRRCVWSSGIWSVGEFDSGCSGISTGSAGASSTDAGGDGEEAGDTGDPDRTTGDDPASSGGEDTATSYESVLSASSSSRNAASPTGEAGDGPRGAGDSPFDDDEGPKSYGTRAYLADDEGLCCDAGSGDRGDPGTGDSMGTPAGVGTPMCGVDVNVPPASRKGCLEGTGLAAGDGAGESWDGGRTHGRRRTAGRQVLEGRRFADRHGRRGPDLAAGDKEGRTGGASTEGNRPLRRREARGAAGGDKEPEVDDDVSDREVLT
ncbi:hypothetical protein MRX96_025867 [Rhipicephalus microplus]